MSDTVTSAMLRDEIKSLEAFMNTQTYASARGAFNSEFDNAMAEVLDSQPNTIGDTVKREQFIGEARAYKVARDFFSDYMERLQGELALLEHPLEVTELEPNTQYNEYES